MTTLIKALAFAALVTASLSMTSPEPVDPQPLVTKPDAQKDTVERRRFPGVFVPDANGQPQPMEISKLDVNVEITGTLARTTIDMTVLNPHNRVLEGEFSFPLNDGQTVARFALDINGKLREAVVVSKSKGRETFEEVIRTKIDPALLEWTRDNSFKTRIYPIPAKGTRRVVIAYEQALTNTDHGLAYTIPFAYPAPPSQFTFACTVAGFGEVPSLTGGSRYQQFTPRGREYTVRFAESSPKLDRPFTIDIPVSLSEHLITVNTFENADYFGAFMTMSPELRTAAAPQGVTLLWDASLSAEHRDRQAELAVLDALFTRIGSADVRLMLFADRVFSDRRYPVRNGNWAELRRWIEAAPIDGATQLGAVRFDVPDDMVILLSDGISTIGQHRPVLGRSPVHVLSSGVPADHDILHTIARETGGGVYAVGHDEPASVASAILGSRRMITDIRVVDGLIEDIRPTGKIPVEHITSITGRLLSESATLEVVSSIDGADERIEEVTINAAEHRVDGQTVARLWAMGELQRLNADRVRNAEAILALGQRFTIVTPNTSLLVLERIQDYVRFNIQPPSSEPELLASWKEQRSRVVQDSAAKQMQHERHVMAMIAERREYITRQPEVQLRAVTPAHRYDTTRGVVDFFEDNASVGTLADDDTPAQDLVVTERSLDATSQPLSVAKGSDLVVRGSRFSQTPVLMDGLPVAEDRSSAIGNSGRAIPATMPSPLSYEVTATTGGFGAEYGNATGGIVNTTVRDGRSELASALQPARRTRTQVIDALNKRGVASTQLATVQQREQWTDTLQNLKGADLYAAYLRLRPRYRSVTSFYLDVCDALRADGQSDLALRVLSNLAELNGEDARDLRILGHRLLQLSYHDLAIGVFEDVLRIRNEEPQSYRDLALALTAVRRFDEAAYNLAMIIEKPWHNRFPEIELIAAMELSRLVQKYGAEMDMSRINNAYLLPAESDVRVVLSWDADNCDMDLWVIDPNGEVCKYNNPNTRIGGHLSRDLTGGYGPEEFLLPKAVKGTYTVKVHYYGNRQQNLARPTTVQVAMFTNYGTEHESERAVTMRLDGVSRVVDVGSFEVD